MTSAAGARVPATPIAATVGGTPGLALDVFTHLLTRAGVTVVGGDDADVPPDVAVLVEPTTEHWSALQGGAAPIVLVLGHEGDDAMVIDAVLAGADAVLHWGCPPATVMAALSEVSRGGSVLVPAHVRAVAGLARAAASRPAVALSRREAEILGSIAQGRAVKQTARELGISPKTVENLQGRMFRKLGVRNRAQAVTRAHALGLLTPSPP